MPLKQKKERHDKAVEQLEVAQTAVNTQRIQRLDFINEEMKKSTMPCRLLRMNQAIKNYYCITGKHVQTKQLVFIALGMIAAGSVACKFL